MTTITEPQHVNSSHTNELLTTASAIISLYVDKEEFKRHFGIAQINAENMFQALVDAKVAKDIPHAIKIVGMEFQPPFGCNWNSVAKWLIEYNRPIKFIEKITQ